MNYKRNTYRQTEHSKYSGISSPSISSSSWLSRSRLSITALQKHQNSNTVIDNQYMNFLFVDLGRENLDLAFVRDRFLAASTQRALPPFK